MRIYKSWLNEGDGNWKRLRPDGPPTEDGLQQPTIMEAIVQQDPEDGRLFAGYISRSTGRPPGDQRAGPVGGSLLHLSRVRTHDAFDCMDAVDLLFELDAQRLKERAQREQEPEDGGGTDLAHAVEKLVEARIALALKEQGTGPGSIAVYQLMRFDVEKATKELRQALGNLRHEHEHHFTFHPQVQGNQETPGDAPENTGARQKYLSVRDCAKRFVTDEIGKADEGERGTKLLEVIQVAWEFGLTESNCLDLCMSWYWYNENDDVQAHQVRLAVEKTYASLKRLKRPCGDLDVRKLRRGWLRRILEGLAAYDLPMSLETLSQIVNNADVPSPLRELAAQRFTEKVLWSGTEVDAQHAAQTLSLLAHHPSYGIRLAVYDQISKMKRQRRELLALFAEDPMPQLADGVRKRIDDEWGPIDWPGNE